MYAQSLSVPELKKRKANYKILDIPSGQFFHQQLISCISSSVLVNMIIVLTPQTCAVWNGHSQGLLGTCSQPKLQLTDAGFPAFSPRIALLHYWCQGYDTTAKQHTGYDNKVVIKFMSKANVRISKYFFESLGRKKRWVWRTFSLLSNPLIKISFV